jgi:hypothetical protein
MQLESQFNNQKKIQKKKQQQQPQNRYLRNATWNHAANKQIEVNIVDSFIIVQRDGRFGLIATAGLDAMLAVFWLIIQVNVARDIGKKFNFTEPFNASYKIRKKRTRIKKITRTETKTKEKNLKK